MKIGLVVATFGSEEWAARGERTLEKVRDPHPYYEFIHVHGKSLGEARNKGARYLTLAHDVSHLVFLDADDDLSPHYLTEMAESSSLRTMGIYRPSTLGVYPDGSTDDYPVLIPRTHMGAGNCIVLGAMCDAWLFDEVGGFDVHLPALEDWDLWIKMILMGAEVHDAPRAVYRVGVSEDSRNKNRRDHGNAYSTIRRRYSAQRGKLDIR